MTHTKISIASCLLSLGISTASIAAPYTLYTSNKTQELFTVNVGLNTVGTLEAKEKLKKFEFDTDDSVLFISNNIPRVTIKYNESNQRPQCLDLFQGYSCDFTKAPGTSSYLLTIEK